jgi:hypothetical protein
MASCNAVVFFLIGIKPSTISSISLSWSRRSGSMSLGSGAAPEEVDRSDEGTIFFTDNMKSFAVTLILSGSTLSLLIEEYIWG